MQTDRPVWWLTVAEKEIGTSEVPGPADNPRIREYHATTTLGEQRDEVPWCSSFVNWVMLQAGIRGTNSALAASWLKWGEACEPVPGAVCVIRAKQTGADRKTGSATGNHVGFFLSKTESHITLLGGNQSNAVKRSSYPLARYKIRGYRWPAKDPNDGTPT